MAKFGGTCSILAGLVFLVSGALYFAFQAGQFDWNSIGSISAYLRTQPGASTAWSLINGGAMLASFLAIASVLALADELQAESAGLVRWTSTLAIIGYSVIAITNIADLYQIRRLTAGYPQAEAATQRALEIIGSGTLDPVLILRFITLGSWFLAAGWVSMRAGLFSRVWAYLGVITGGMALLYVVVAFLDIAPLMSIALAPAIILHPVWLIWTGVLLRRSHGQNLST